MLSTLLFSWTLTLGCKPASEESAEPQDSTLLPPGDSLQPSDTEERDSEDSPSDTEDTQEDTGTIQGDWEIRQINAEGWGDFGYAVYTYSLAADASEPYSSLFQKERPTFYLLRPVELPSEPLQILVWLHGGGIGDDSAAESGGDLPEPCRVDKILDFSTGPITDPSFVQYFAMQEQQVIYIPRNDWCDAWQGLGPDDPVDPERHYSYYHFARGLDFLRSGEAGFTASEGLLGWGTSAGAMGVVSAAARYGNFSAIHFDSGIGSMITYYNLNDTGAMEHIFGGPPYDKSGDPNGEVYDRYMAASPGHLLAQSEWTTPVYVSWNTQDLQVQASQVTQVLNALEERGDSLRWGAHDFDHAAPGSTYHVQSIYGLTPWGYYTAAFHRFLDGQDLWIQEAESTCNEGCAVGEVRSVETHGGSYVNFSLETVREAGAGVSGVLYQGRIPELQSGRSYTVAPVMKVVGHNALSPEVPVLSVSYGDSSEDEELLIYAGDLCPEGSDDPELLLGQYAATRLSFTPQQVETGMVTIRTTGAAVIQLDSLLYETL